jgi:hypothetical protein
MQRARAKPPALVRPAALPGVNTPRPVQHQLSADAVMAASTVRGCCSGRRVSGACDIIGPQKPRRGNIKDPAMLLVLS